MFHVLFGIVVLFDDNFQRIDQFITDPVKIIASDYSGTLGVPVIYPSSYFKEISEVSDDEGAKHLIFKHQDELISLPFPAGKYDLDTREDYEQILEMI